MGWFFSKKYTENDVYDLEAKGDVNELIQIVKSEGYGLGIIYSRSYDSIRVRWAAIEALGNLEDKRAADTLIGIITSTKWDGIGSDSISCRGMAGTALGKIRDDRAIIPLIKLLWQGNIISVIEDALVEFGESAVLPLINAVEARTLSMNQYTGKPDYDDPYGIHASSAKILGRIGDESAVEPLMKALIKYNNPSSNSAKVRGDIAMALGNIGDKRAVETLITHLKDKNGNVRTNSAKALKEIGDERAVEPLVKALEDKVAKVRKAASESLMAFGKNDIVNEFNIKEKQRTNKKSRKKLKDSSVGFVSDHNFNFKKGDPIILCLGTLDNPCRKMRPASMRFGCPDMCGGNSFTEKTYVDEKWAKENGYR